MNLLNSWWNISNNNLNNISKVTTWRKVGTSEKSAVDQLSEFEFVLVEIFFSDLRFVDLKSFLDEILVQIIASLSKNSIRNLNCE